MSEAGREWGVATQTRWTSELRNCNDSNAHLRFMDRFLSCSCLELSCKLNLHLHTHTRTLATHTHQYSHFDTHSPACGSVYEPCIKWLTISESALSGDIS